MSIVDRPLDRRRDTPVADRKQNRVAPTAVAFSLDFLSGRDADLRPYAGKLAGAGSSRTCEREEDVESNRETGVAELSLGENAHADPRLYLEQHTVEQRSTSDFAEGET